MKAADAVAFEALILAGPMGMRAPAARLAPQIEERLRAAFPLPAARWSAEYLFTPRGMLHCEFTASDGVESEKLPGEAIALIQLRGLLRVVAEMPIRQPLQERVQVFQQLLHLSWIVIQGRPLKAAERRSVTCANQGRAVAKDAAGRHAEWQRMALAVWAKHPRWTESAVAAAVAEQLAEAAKGTDRKTPKPDTIARRISNPNAKPRKPRAPRAK